MEATTQNRVRVTVEINGTEYNLRPNPRVRYSFTLSKGDGTVYQVSASGCSCPDATYRHRRQCKHYLALRAVGIVD